MAFVALEDGGFHRRLLAAGVVAFLMLSSIVTRLWYLQCVKGTYYRDQSENNRTRTIRTAAPRGSMFDREGKVLVRNRPAFNLALMTEDVPDIKLALHTIAELTGRDLESLEKRLQSQTTVRRHFEPKILIPDISHEELARVRANGYRLPGVIVNAEPTREFPFQQLASHLFGYSREITKEQLAAQVDGRYRLGDLVGQSGLEKRYEEYLGGTSGYERIEVDARGSRRGELGIVGDIPGQDIFLTIDVDVQREAEAAFQGYRGAAVVLDPNNGEVLAMVSAPSVDANILSGRISGRDWDKLTSEGRPLLNRAVGAIYPPGSTWKLIMASAALASGKISTQTELNCPGYYSFGGRRYRCHKHSGHGRVNLAKAIAQSCNAYFYQVGNLLGIDEIHRYGVMFGYGERTGIEVQDEVAGSMPSPEWKRETRKQPWYPGDTLPVAIGQGYLVVTPIQMAVGISALANGGTVYQPHVLSRVIDQNGIVVRRAEPQVTHFVKISSKVLETVREMAAGVVEDDHGTGKKAALPGIRVGGKTGTAQVGALGKEVLGDHMKDHAWFVAFAPVENPMIALAIVVENGGHGGATAAPISKRIMEVFFRKRGMLVEEQPVSSSSSAPSIVPLAPPADPAELTPEDDEGTSDENPAELASGGTVLNASEEAPVPEATAPTVSSIVSSTVSSIVSPMASPTVSGEARP